MFMQVLGGGEDEAAGAVGRAAKGAGGSGGGPASSPGSMQGATAAQGAIKYGDLKGGLPTGVKAIITRNMPKGSEANVNPTGWVTGGVINNRVYERAHLLAKRFGGSGYTKRNLAIVLRSVNRGVMKTYENEVAQAIASGEVVWYRVTPIYKGTSNLPHAITLEALGSRGFNLGVSIFNREP